MNLYKNEFLKNNNINIRCILTGMFGDVILTFEDNSELNYTITKWLDYNLINNSKNINHDIKQDILNKLLYIRNQKMEKIIKKIDDKLY